MNTTKITSGRVEEKKKTSRLYFKTFKAYRTFILNFGQFFIFYIFLYFMGFGYI